MSVIRALSLTYAPAMAFAVVGLYWGAFAAQIPVLKAQLGAGDALFGTLLLGTSFGLVSTMFLAPALDRKLGVWAMPVSALGLAIAFMAPGYAVTPAAFFFAMMLAGMASGLTDVIMNARVSEVEAKTGRSLMNANHGMFSIAYAIAAIAAGFGRELGLSPPEIFAGLGVVTLCLITQMRTVAAPDLETTENPVKFPYATVLLCGAVVLIAFMAEAAVEGWSALHVERTLGGRAAEGALGPAMLGLTMAIGRFGGQVVFERWSELTSIRYAGLLAMLGALVAAIAPTPLVAYLGFGILGLGVSVIGPLGLALVGRLVPPQVRTKAIARAAVLGFVGFFAAPAIMGFVSDAWGLPFAFAMVAVLISVLFPLAALIRRRSDP